MTYAVSNPKNDVPVFENERITKAWENLHHKWFSWKNYEFQPYTSTDYHLFVDLIESKDKLRLLTIYDSEQKTFITDEEMLSSIAMDLSLEVKRDRFGNWLGDPEDEGVNYGHKLYQTCPNCKTENRPMYDDNPHLAFYCDCTRGRWDDQVWS